MPFPATQHQEERGGTERPADGAARRPANLHSIAAMPEPKNREADWEQASGGLRATVYHHYTSDWRNQGRRTGGGCAQFQQPPKTA